MFAVPRSLKFLQPRVSYRKRNKSHTNYAADHAPLMSYFLIVYLLALLMCSHSGGDDDDKIIHFLTHLRSILLIHPVKIAYSTHEHTHKKQTIIERK